MKSFLAAIALLAAAGHAGAERAITLETTVNATAREVYRAWATRDGIKTFFAPDGIVDPRPNGLYEIHFDPSAPPGLRGAEDMRILALQEDRMISFTWNAPPAFPAARGQRTVVIVRLHPAAEGRTRVTLHQVGWGDGGDWDGAYAYFGKAWNFVLGNLKKRFESGPIDWKPATQNTAATQQK